MKTIKIGDKQIVLADGQWRSSDPALQDLLNDHLASIQSDIPDTYTREDRERFAAEAAASDFDAQIVDSLLTPIEHKDRERHQLERFKACFSEFPQGRIIESEEPDFLLELPVGKFIGIELTELYRTTPANEIPRQAIESLKRQIVQRARSIYEKAGGPPLYVYVYFASRLELKKSYVSQIAQKLAEIVLNNPVAMDQQITLENRYSNRQHFPEQIISVRISRHSFMTDALWAVPDGGAVPQMSAEEIQMAINGKNSKVEAYRKKATGEVWLIVVHGFPMSSWFVRSDSALNHVYQSEFDRVFLFDIFRQAIDKLNTVPVN